MVVRQLGARSIRSLLHWLGFELVNRDAYMQDLARTAHLRSLFRALGINTVIDIGANRGQFIRFLREKVGFSGEIRAYEPNPACVPSLQALCDEDRRLTVQACAVTPTDGRVLLHIARSDELSSVLPLTCELADAFEGGTLDQTIEVAAVSIATILTEANKPSARIFLKIDIQGYDLAVLESARNYFGPVVLVQVEAPLACLYEGGGSLAGIVEFLQSSDFSIAGFYRTSIAGYPCSASDVDVLAIYKRSQMLPAADSWRTLAKTQRASFGAEQLFSRMLSE
jgi:FkbM family methyltransferase